MAGNNTSLENFKFKVYKNVIHLKTQSGDYTYYLCAWHVPNFSSVKTVSIQGFLYDYNYVKLNIDTKRVEVEIFSYKKEKLYKFDISISAHSGNVPLKNHRHTGANLVRASVDADSPFFPKFQELHEISDNSCVVICRILGSKAIFNDLNEKFIPEPKSEYLLSLKADLKNNSGFSSKEKVRLRVGGETEVVNKAVLCAQSPVFSKMFGNDMRELNENTVTITDIKMPVLKTLVSFLYSGILTNCDFGFLCDLYYAADKYDIKDLQVACIELLLRKVSSKNIFKVLKLSLSHNDEVLKSAAMTLISANIETLCLTSDWEIFMRDDPEQALEASTFFALKLFVDG